MGKDETDAILTERGSRYGAFRNNAAVAQRLKEAIRAGTVYGTEPISPDIMEALDLIALKMSRIVTGDPEYLDNWDDIAGYATLVADRIRGRVR